MNSEELQKRNFENEFVYSTSRSSGPGGQNVNKVNSKVELRFNVSSSMLLSDSEKIIIIEKLRNKINSKGEIRLTAQSERTQYQNKKKVVEKFFHLLSDALSVSPDRIPTNPSLNSKIKRLDKKKKRGRIKQDRRIPHDDPTE